MNCGRNKSLFVTDDIIENMFRLPFVIQKQIWEFYPRPWDPKTLGIQKMIIRLRKHPYCRCQCSSYEDCFFHHDPCDVCSSCFYTLHHTSYSCPFCSFHYCNKCLFLLYKEAVYFSCIFCKQNFF